MTVGRCAGRGVGGPSTVQDHVMVIMSDSQIFMVTLQQRTIQQFDKMQTSTVIGITAATAATAFVAYAIYFDQKRRNDPQFRKTLRKQRKQAAKEAKRAAEVNKGKAGQDIRTALAESKALGPLPTTPQEKHEFFMVEVQKGEDLGSAGPSNYATAAAHFYRALQVYPDQIELAMIFQRSLPAPVFELIMGMLEMEASNKEKGQINPKDIDIDDDDDDDRITEIKDSSKAGSSVGISTTEVTSESASIQPENVPNQSKTAAVSSAPSSDAGSGAGDFSIIGKEDETSKQ